MAHYKKYFPVCMGKEHCMCFDTLLGYDGSFSSMSDYIKKTKKTLDSYTLLVDLHDNKDKIVEYYKTTKVSANVIRTMLYYLDLTRTHFQRETNGRINYKIELSVKSVYLNEFLRYYEQLRCCWDMMLSTFYYSDTDMEVSYLKDLLYHHHKLINIFEQFEERTCHGKGETIVGSFNIALPLNLL